MKPGELSSFSEDGALQAVIETPRGSRNKFSYDSPTGLFQLRKVLPLGMSFPFDFGFIPGTLGGDGDPLDVLVLMDEPAFPGCLVRCRLLGVIEAEQTENGKTERNDRLVAKASAGRRGSELNTLADVPAETLREIEAFFTQYDAIDGKRFQVIGRGGPGRARELIEAARNAG